MPSVPASDDSTIAMESIKRLDFVPVHVEVLRQCVAGPAAWSTLVAVEKQIDFKNGV